ncbi:MAG: site-2 protease family protein [Thaumarchaeota archaeon]|nr:site-2 protease family protein [Nitrososphaerota archaeon]MDG6907728.1 site-2 protease family protein [Nitrososphaerota archaeon]
MPEDDLSKAPTDPAEEEPQKEEPPFTFSWGIVMIRTRKLLSALDWLARFRIFADIGWAFLGITLAAAGFMLYLMLDQTYILLTGSLALRCAVGAAPPSQCAQNNLPTTSAPPVQSYLLLPGINPYIPVIYGLIGIIIAVVVHEGTHGVIARRLKLPVKSTGVLLLLIIPIGAFVEIDEKLIQKARFRDSGRIMAGGPGSNIIVSLIALALLLLLVGGLVPIQYNGTSLNGVSAQSIVPGSPADGLHMEHHLYAGDVIVAANGTSVDSVNALGSYLLTTHPNQTLMLSVEHQGVINNYSIVLAKNPDPNATQGFIGIGDLSTVSTSGVKTQYASSFFTRPILYLIVPGIISQANSIVPFSSSLHWLYTSPQLGFAWYPVALTLFWIWFINVNLAFFNAIPLYPLDGGQAMLNFFSHFGRPGVEKRAKALTTVISLLMLAIILSFLLLPRILGMIPY